MTHDALIGHTGFVGGNLAAQHHFAACFNSTSIGWIHGQRFGTLVVSGMPAAKWIANRDPVADRAVLESLWSNVSACEAETVVVISTVDVYPAPLAVDEGTIIAPAFQQTYGLHRLELEKRIQSRFNRVLALRLPGLYGPGLKKNAIFDLIHGNQTDKIHPDGAYQFYDLNRLWKDIQAALAANLTVANLATEPVSMREVGRVAFGFEFGESPRSLAPNYDMRTKHAPVFGGRAGYLETKAQVLAGITAFAAASRRAAA